MIILLMTLVKSIVIELEIMHFDIFTFLHDWLTKRSIYKKIEND